MHIHIGNNNNMLLLSYYIILSLVIDYKEICTHYYALFIIIDTNVKLFEFAVPNIFFFQ